MIGSSGSSGSSGSAGLPQPDVRGDRTAEIAALIVLLVFVAGRCLVPMDETDLFFNLRLGEIVLARHAVPRTNLLSFTHPDFRDLNLAWIFQIVLALAYRAGGIAGTVCLKTAFVLATFALLYRVALRRGAHPAASAAMLALAAWTAEPRFVERPHLVTFVGLAYLLLALERAETGRPRALYALIPLAPIWANANSCFALAPAVLALYGAGARLERRGPDARRAALMALALLPFIFATPSGAGVLTYLANHWRMPGLRPLQEYRAASWPVDGPFFFVAAGVALAFALPGRRFRQLLPVCALGLLGARRIRFVAEFALLAGPLMAVAATELVARLSRAARWAPRGPYATVAVVAALAGLTLVPRLAAVRRGERAVDLSLEPDLIPLPAIRFADDNGLRERMYNDLEVGSYLAWQGWPAHRVFQDPRINGYPEAFHAVLRRDDLSRADWEAFLARFGVTTALVTFPDVNPRAALFAPARWALVYRDADALVFAARRPEFAALIARAEIPLTFGFARGAGVTAQPLPIRPSGSPVRGCDWQKRLGDVLFETGDEPGARAAYAAAGQASDCLAPASRQAAALARGDLALKSGDDAAAVEAYAGLTEPRARANRGLALMSLGRAREAEVDLSAALAVDPRQPEARLAQAFAFEALGRGPEAVASFRAFLALAPGHAAAARARAEIERLGGR
jgi:tetratricopeptide (TPR) repeat protein